MYSPKKREWSESRGEASRPQTQVRTSELPSDANVLKFTPDDTQWHRRICLFLAERPNATLFAVVQHLWPDFLALPASRRAQTWFWAKEQLQRLSDANILRRREEADGVPLWSLAPARPSIPPAE